MVRIFLTGKGSQTPRLLNQRTVPVCPSLRNLWSESWRVKERDLKFQFIEFLEYIKQQKRSLFTRSKVNGIHADHVGGLTVDQFKHRQAASVAGQLEEKNNLFSVTNSCGAACSCYDDWQGQCEQCLQKPTRLMRIHQSSNSSSVRQKKPWQKPDSSQPWDIWDTVKWFCAQYLGFCRWCTLLPSAQNSGLHLEKTLPVKDLLRRSDLADHQVMLYFSPGVWTKVGFRLNFIYQVYRADNQKGAAAMDHVGKIRFCTKAYKYSTPKKPCKHVNKVNMATLKPCRTGLRQWAQN